MIQKYLSANVPVSGKTLITLLERSHLHLGIILSHLETLYINSENLVAY